MIHDIFKTLQGMGLLKDLDEHQLLQAAQEQGISLENYLLDTKMITHLDLARAYSHDYQLPLVEFITEEMADPVLLSKIQFNFLRQNLVIPIMLQGKVAIVVADPLNLSTIDELAMLLAKDAT